MSKRLKAFAVAIGIAAGITIAPQAAFASGGGCGDSVVWNGWQIGVCITAAGNVLKPDYYVNQHGSSPSGCVINSYYRNVGSGALTLLNSGSCSARGVGHYGPFSVVVPSGPGLKYDHVVDIGPVSGQHLVKDSPDWLY